uniref:C-type lectin domain-containing protein n=1 Tax=Panagrolaimus superbus TaxID=310955 RepID=A0A914Z9T1_9BILA
MECPANSTYNSCISYCQPSCLLSQVTACATDGCVEGCLCNTGFVIDHKKSPFGCIKAEDCGKEDPVAVKCTGNFTYFEPTNSCYGVNENILQANWSAAETLCKSYKGNLASIENAEELKFLIGLTVSDKYYPWSGLYTNDGGKTWKWSDGSSASYISWAPGFPTLKESCVLIRKDGLIDYNCNSPQQYICKIKL